MWWMLVVACVASSSDVGAGTSVVVGQAHVVPLPAGWVERVVGAEDDASPLPMIVMAHGLGDRPESMLSVLAEFPGPARIIAPRAPDAWHEGWSWFPTRVSGDEEVLAGQIAAVSDRFVKDLEGVVATRPTTGKPILTGFSQGGMLSLAVAVRHPEAIAAAVPVAGWLPEPLWPAAVPPGAPPIHALHGLDEEVLPFARTAAGVDAVRKVGWTADMQAFPGVGHRIPPQVRAALFEGLASAIAAQ